MKSIWKTARQSLRPRGSSRKSAAAGVTWVRSSRIEQLESRQMLNIAPVAQDDSYAVIEGTTLSIGRDAPAGLFLEEFDGHFYALVGAEINWLEANTAAQALTYRGVPGHLVTINSAAEHQFLKDNIYNNAVAHIHIGLTDQENEGVFEWVTGEPLTFTSWRSNEPNNAGNEDAVEMYQDGVWNDTKVTDVNNAYIVEFEGPFMAGVLENDSDTDADALNILVVNDVSRGQFEWDADGTFSYTPEPGFTGIDAFTYVAQDGTENSNIATVTIEVLPNNPPVAGDDEYEIVVGADLEIEQNVAPGLVPVFWPDNGHYYLVVDESLTWSEAEAAARNFSFRGAQGHLVTITSAEEQQFVNSDVIADVPLRYDLHIGLNDIAVEGIFRWATGERFDYENWWEDQPDNFFNDDAVEMYSLRHDGTWNDIPVDWSNDAYVIEFDGPFSAGVLLNDNDAEGDALIVSLVEDVEHGNLDLANDGSFTYQPAAGFVGVDTFKYQVADGLSRSNIATVSIRVNGPPTAVNDPDYSVDEDTALVVPAEDGVLVNDIDGENDALTALLIDDVDNGSLTLNGDGGFSYLPAPDFFGVDAFTYVARDGNSDSNTATVTITVNPLPDAPAANDDRYLINEDSTLIVTATLHPTDGLIHRWTFDETTGNTASDIAGDNDIALFNWRNRENKWATGRIGGALDFTSDVDNYGLTNSSITLDQSTISFWLNVAAAEGVNPRIVDAPNGGVLINNEYNRGIGFYYGNGATNAQDPQSPEIGVWEHYAVVFDRAESFATVYRNGKQVAAADVARDLSVGRWTIGHNQGVAVQTDSLHGLLDDLRAYNRLLTPAEVVALAAGWPGVLHNDKDVDGDALAAILVDDVAHGTLTLNPDGTFAYSPDADFHGQDSFSYKVNDGSNDSGVATVIITVTPVNDPPVADADEYLLPFGATSLVVNPAEGVLVNDDDQEMAILSAELIDGPLHGGLTLNPDGSFEYIPDETFHVVDSFTYVAHDGEDVSSPTTVTIALDVPVVNIGTHELASDRAGQTIELFVSGGHAVSGLNLFLQVGDGGPELTDFGLPAGTDGPSISAVDLKTGTVFNSISDTQSDLGGIPQVKSYSIAISEPGGSVPAQGLLATITIDTTGIFEGTFDLLLTGILPALEGGPFDSDFAGLPARIGNGSIVVVPPTVVGRRVFYNNSKLDGENPLIDAADDLAVATDKSALLPGGTAMFANYTSYSRGLNGVIIDVKDLRGITTIEDFQFRVGNTSDPTQWREPPAPAEISVRPGAGQDGSDRIVITWPDGAIAKQWLQVTLKATANSGLAGDDVFYFGNAIGETGNDPVNALVNATDVIAARDNPHGPLNQAEIDNPFDFNRDRLVNATDVILARDNGTSPFNALRLIAVPPPVEPAAGPTAPRAATSRPQSAERTSRARLRTAIGIFRIDAIADNLPPKTAGVGGGVLSTGAVESPAFSQQTNAPTEYYGFDSQIWRSSRGHASAPKSTETPRPEIWEQAFWQFIGENYS